MSELAPARVDDDHLSTEITQSPLFSVSVQQIDFRCGFAIGERNHERLQPDATIRDLFARLSLLYPEGKEIAGVGQHMGACRIVRAGD